MCLLVLQKEGATLSENELKNSAVANPDGIGYSFVRDGKIMTKKFRSLSKFMKGYDTDTGIYGMSSPFLLHFRYATHGENKGVENVHPFKVRDDLVFAHNGMIDGVSKSEVLSDTQMFNMEILQRLQTLDEDFLKNIVLVKLIAEFVSGSKLAFLHADKTFSIINETSGHWNDAETIWFSNYGYKDVPQYQTYGYNYGSYGRYADYSGKGLAKRSLKPYNQPVEQKKVADLFKATPDYDVLQDDQPECEWCGFESGDLKTCNVSDYYITGEAITAELCPECSKSKDCDTGGCDDTFSLC